MIENQMGRKIKKLRIDNKWEGKLGAITTDVYL